jgi:hypothetical protein
VVDGSYAAEACCHEGVARDFQRGRPARNRSTNGQIGHYFIDDIIVFKYQE